MLSSAGRFGCSTGTPSRSSVNVMSTPAASVALTIAETK